MNYLDIGLIIVLLIFTLAGRNRGLIKTCLGFIPLVGGLFITNEVYPYVSRFVRGTFLFDKLKDGVTKHLSLDSFSTIQGANITDLQKIESLKLPEFLKSSLIENNNSVVKNVLGADGIGDYIASYITNTCINVLCMIVVFCAVVYIIRMIIAALDLVSKLPILNFLNKTLGAIAGFIQGVIFVWLTGIVLIFFYSNPGFSKVFEMLYSSKVALFLYENNVLLFMVMKIVA